MFVPIDDFEQLALGEATDGQRPMVDGYPVHCDGFRLPSDPKEKQVVLLEDCIRGVRARGAERVAVWLGNSQLHAINHYKPGDQLASGPIHDRLSAHGLDLITVSYPNADQQEHLVTYA